ncbi:MAG TPA: FUSC family protein [Mycobacterium sp.]
MAHVEIVDPGLVRSRRGVRAVCATVLAWATMVAVAAAFHVEDPLRITLFAAGAAFEGALLAPDPQPRERVRTLGWAAVVSAAAVAATVQLAQFAVWTAAALLGLLMFSSYALRSWSSRAASLALMGAITVYVTGAGYITIGRVGWFVLAVAIGFGWLTLWESLILPDDPLRSLQRSVRTFSGCAADTVAGVVDVLATARDNTSSERARKALRNNLDRVRSCRNAIERQFPGAILRGVGQDDADRLRVVLHSVQKGLEDMVEQVDLSDWMGSLPDEVAWSVSSSVHGLSVALRDDGDGQSAAFAVRSAQALRGHLHDALTQTTTTGSAPFAARALLAAFTLVGAGEVVAQSVTQARVLASAPEATSRAAPPTANGAGSPEIGSASNGLTPTMALAIQVVAAAVAAGLIAKAVGNEQSVVVAWTAFVVIAGSAGLSTRRAMVRIPTTVLGAASGVLIAATVPDTVGVTIAVVAVGVFFTILSAPVSYPAMVFWMNIAFVPLFASQGRYLDLIWDKTMAALIGGGVAAVVALVIVPIRSAREVRPAVLTYLQALDGALASHLPGHERSVAAAEAELDSAHAALIAKVSSAATETNVFSQPENVRNVEADHVDAVHDAYQRLTPLLFDSARLLHGWSDDQVGHGIHRLREAVESAESSARGEGERAARVIDEPTPSANTVASLRLSDSRRRIETLHSALRDLARILDGNAVLATPN